MPKPKQLGQIIYIRSPSDFSFLSLCAPCHRPFYTTNAARLNTVYPNKQLVYFRNILSHFMTNREKTDNIKRLIFLKNAFTVVY